MMLRVLFIINYLEFSVKIEILIQKKFI